MSYIHLRIFRIKNFKYGEENLINMPQKTLEKIIKTGGSTLDSNTHTISIPIILGSSQKTINTVSVEIK